MGSPQTGSVNALVAGGYAPLTAMVLSARGIENPRQAKEKLDCDCALCDPFTMKDMAKAVMRVRQGIEQGEKIAVFGDYDVDGITSTCLLYEYLRSEGADVITYIPGRMEEGYGLNSTAIRQLYSQGVQLIITVDCGITAVAEAALCKELGIGLVITDHHECKDKLPDAAAVVDPHRPDCTYPHQNLSGVGVAFKLASALYGSQEQILNRYGDMVCLGTVADVMPLQGENRVFVSRGLEMMQHDPRLGIASLMHECGCAPENLSATTIGFILSPRINAAGRMEQIELATELFLTRDRRRAAAAAAGLCDLNRQRQSVEAQIYEQVTAALAAETAPTAIVLKGETWHQGVVGIVASRIAEEYHCPTFLICMDGDHGKASSRSYGGFNLFAALKELSPLLESYGGHELAAGFTIHRNQIGAFRERISEMTRDFFAQSDSRTVLEIDCSVTPEVLTVHGIDALSALEPCGNGCPKPMLMMEKLQIERISMVGGGRHMRLRVRNGRHSFNAIYFGANPQIASVEPGDLVDIAFQPQVNEFKGERSVQMNVQDIRPACVAATDADESAYRHFRRGDITPELRAYLTPDRATLGMVWRYLSNASQPVQESAVCLCRKIVRWSGKPLDTAQLLICLDIFADVGLLYLDKHHNDITLRLSSPEGKADLNQSQTMQDLLLAKES